MRKEKKIIVKIRKLQYLMSGEKYVLLQHIMQKEMNREKEEEEKD